MGMIPIHQRIKSISINKNRKIARAEIRCDADFVNGEEKIEDQLNSYG